MTPPCPTCRLPLRWFPPQNQWGCDRCQKLFPVSVAKRAAAGLPSWLGLAIAGGAVVIGVVLAVVLKKGDDHHGRDVDSAGYGGYLKMAGADCDHAIENASSVTLDLLRTSGVDETKLPAIKDMLRTRCTTDDWPAEAITCMAELSTQTELEACMKKLPPEAVEHLSTDMMALMKE